jgi:hypothetical protein
MRSCSRAGIFKLFPPSTARLADGSGETGCNSSVIGLPSSGPNHGAKLDEICASFGIDTSVPNHLYRIHQTNGVDTVDRVQEGHPY